MSSAIVSAFVHELAKSFTEAIKHELPEIIGNELGKRQEGIIRKQLEGAASMLLNDMNIKISKYDRKYKKFPFG